MNKKDIQHDENTQKIFVDPEIDLENIIIIYQTLILRVCLGFNRCLY